ncbi:hypothetical protein A0126_18705 (plasmid) [Exiguobacterium sp. N4-1P]|uniref:hypothetical protein n=1 Tax=Exiguobacterium sp. N4-1P TaxID=2051906 RepID=UPI000B591CCE|nr:hypothetical protein [Exiguobacterium sp. N4-1P]ASI36847.1 hypothetical protein A0126_15025 [Exiguobacterium sp. N4-1P]ASI37620.1 hypothetical protein A0126_18705 [Exiguobacterium sp. N4-1P]
MQTGKRKTLTRDWSRLYLGTGMFFLIGFLFFGFSSLFFAEEQPINATPIGEEQRLTNGQTVTLLDWSHDEERKQMRVRLQFDQPQDYATKLVAHVAYKEQPTDEKRVHIVYHQDEHYVFEIEDVPRDFDQLALRLYVIESQQSLEKLSATKREEALVESLYMDQRRVLRTSLSTQQANDYAQLFLADEHVQSQKRIKKMKREQMEQASLIQKIEQDIETKQATLPDLTLDEQVEREDEIFNLKQDKEDALLRQTELKKQLTQEEKRQDQLRIKARELKW